MAQLSETDRQERATLVARFNKAKKGSNTRMKTLEAIYMFEERILKEGKNGK